MKKVQVKLPTKDWGTTKTKYPPDSVYVSPDEFTAGTQNLDTQLKGVITKPLGGVSYNTTSLLPFPVVDQFEAIFSSGTRHLLVMSNGTLYYSSGNGLFNSVTSGYSPTGNMEFAQYLDRVYFDNGINTPQVYDTATSYGGVTYTAPKTKDMGAQPPVTPVTFAADTAGGNVPNGAHTYEVTFLYYGFEESNGGPASAVHTVANPNHTVNLTSVPIGGYGVTARKIYRDNNDGVYLLLGTINDNTTTIFTDTFLSGTTPIPTTNDAPPTFSLITNFLSRLWVAGVPGSPSTIFFSNAGLPDIFDPLNFLVCNPTDPIQAIVIYLDTLIVLNRHSVGVITGTSSADFAYSDIQIGVGCVDNRSVQVRTIEGVPKLVWLSDKGFYQYNGASFEYISDDIEDLVNFNIAQGQVVKGHNAQDTETDFAAGSFTPSIDIITNPGFIQSIPTSTEFENETEWESGVLTNISTHDGSNTIKVPTQFAPSLSSGSFNGTIQSGNTLTLGTGTNFTGESFLVANTDSDLIQTATRYMVQPISPTLDGTITSITVGTTTSVFAALGINPDTYQLKIYRDNSGIPGTLVYTGPLHTASGESTRTESVSISVTANEKIWIGYQTNQGNPSHVLGAAGNTAVLFNNLGFYVPQTSLNGTSWSPTPNILTMSSAYTFSEAPIQASGQWTSPIYDSFSDSVSSGMSVSMTGSYPTMGTTSSLMITGSNNSDMSSPSTTDTVNNLNGTSSISTSGTRYWQLTITLSTDDARNVPVVGPPTLQFNITGIWVSPAIDRSTDVVSDDNLNIVENVPAGTTVTVLVATSANNITYTSFVPFGTEVVQRYMKIQATLVATSDDVTTPFITSIQTDWTVTGTFTSSIIDTGANPPAGWDVFQAVTTLNGGTIAFFFRSASTSGGIPAAIYQSVTNGAFPTNTPLEFCQWKAVITSSDSHRPNIDSVTVNWFLSITQSSRVASIFYNRTYYMAAEELGQNHNNIVLELDDRNKWRILAGVTINTLSFFFNNPFYGDALTGNVIKWFQGTTNYDGSSIVMDLRTKSFDFAMFDKTKILRKVYVKLLNTGAIYQFFYSVDDGNTFFPLIVETQLGNTALMTPNDGKLAFHRLQPLSPTSESGNKFYGKTIMLRVLENTSATVELHEIKAEAWIREGELIETT